LQSICLSVSCSAFFPFTLKILPPVLAVQKYQHMYKANAATSHYLLSKVFRAKERIDQEFPEESTEWKMMHGDPTEAAQKAAKEAAAMKAEKARGGADAPGGGSGDKSDSGTS
jgi:hypothetical protein